MRREVAPKSLVTGAFAAHNEVSIQASFKFEAEIFVQATHMQPQEFYIRTPVFSGNKMRDQQTVFKLKVKTRRKLHVGVAMEGTCIMKYISTLFL